MQKAWLITIAIAIPFVLSTFFLSSSLLSPMLYPFLKIESWIVQPMQRYVKKWQHWDVLGQQLNDREQEVRILREEVVTLQAALQHVDDTQELHEWQQRYRNTKKYAVQVLLCTLSNREHSYIVDAGSARGITTDMVAVWHNAILGKVTHVTRYWSRVTLITDTTCKVAAVCAHTKTEGILEGIQQPGALRLDFVDHLLPVIEGDNVLSIGDGLVFPRGFLLGIIDSAEVENCKYSIIVKPTVDFSSIRFCSLIQKGAEYDTLEEPIMA